MTTTTTPTRSLELVAILRKDGNLSEREICRLADINQRTLRNWKTGKARSISKRHVRQLEVAVQRHRCVPWSACHDGLARVMWQEYCSGGQSAVVESLQAELDPDSSEQRKGAKSDLKRDLKRAEAKSEWAFDVDPAVYRQGGARALVDIFEDYAKRMEEDFRSAKFPRPSTAKPEHWTTVKPEHWTTVLFLLQYTRDTAATAPGEVNLRTDLHDWLAKACAFLRNKRDKQGKKRGEACSAIVLLRLVEGQLVPGSPDVSLEMRRQYLEAAEAYANIVPGNAVVARNALAAASAIAAASGRRSRTLYLRWHERLVALDPEWNDPLRLGELNRLDRDFEDFLVWWREHRSIEHRKDNTRIPIAPTITTSGLALFAAAAIAAGMAFAPAVEEPALARMDNAPSLDVDTSRASSAGSASVIRIADIRPSGPYMESNTR